MNIKATCSAIILSVFMLTSVTNAEIIATDNFNYKDGDISGKNGGQGWNTDKSGKTSWERPTNNTKIKKGQLVTGRTSSITRYFTKNKYSRPIKKGKIFVGLDIAATQDGKFKNGFHLVNGKGKAIAFFGTDVYQGSKVRWKISNSALSNFNNNWNLKRAVTQKDLPRSFTVPVRIVAMVDLDNNKLAFWLKDANGKFIESKPAATLDFRYDPSAGDLNKQIAGINIGGIRDMVSDNLVVATTFKEAAAPEPATMLLLIGGAAGVLTRRRRKNI